MKKIIMGKDIVKSFQSGNEKTVVLHDVSVSLNEGEFVSVMGPSGSGKSTLMYALSGMEEIDSGKVVFDGCDLSSFQEAGLADIRRRKMGFIFQQPTLLKNLNILDNIILPSMRDNRKNAGEIIKKAEKLMEKVGIGELAQRDITQVSGGQLQRVGICRALMNNPEIIFGDEPTGALNSRAAEEIMDILSLIHQEGAAVMLVTHDARVAARTERVLFMHDGRIVSEIKLYGNKKEDMENRIQKVTTKMMEIGI